MNKTKMKLVVGTEAMFLICLFLEDFSSIQGAHLFYAKGCQYCHAIHVYGWKAGAELTTIGNRLSERELTDWRMGVEICLPAAACFRIKN